jgi:preprotein translocase subunit SecB
MNSDRPTVQNKIKFVKFFVKSLKYKIENENENDISEDLEISLKVSSVFDDENDKNYLVNFKLEIKSKDEDLVIKVNAFGLFSTLDAITDEFKLSSFVKVSSPAIAFPFLRSYINTITTNSGISPIILPSFNFTK